MTALFTPHVGLMVWTIVTFLLLVAILAKFGWKPIIKAIEDHENSVRAEREAAERAREEARRLQAELEVQLAAIDARAKEALAKASQEAEALRARHEADARDQAKRLLDKTRAELEEERRRLVARLRTEVANLAVTAAEKLLKKSVDEGVRKTTLEQFFQELDAPGKRS